MFSSEILGNLGPIAVNRGYFSAIVLVIAALSVVGINAMVTVTMLVGALAHAPATGLSPLKLVFPAEG